MLKRIVLLAVVVLSLFACAPKEGVLRMVVIPADDGVSTEQRYQPFVDYIEQSAGVKVELIMAASYTAVVEAMKYEHADIARFGPMNYVQATEEANIEPLVVACKKNSGQPFYNGVIITRPGLEDLNGVTFAFVDPGSGSGYGAPSVYLLEHNIELGKVLFAGSHPAVIEAVKNGSVDAGAVADNRWFTALEEGAVTEDEVVVFATTDPIPNALWAVQSDMDPKLKASLLEAFLGLPEDIVYGMGIQEIRFLPAHDFDYDIMRDILEVID